MKKESSHGLTTKGSRNGSGYLTFWDEVAKSDVEWFESYEEVLDSNAPFYRWFVGGKIHNPQLPGQAYRFKRRQNSDNMAVRV